MATLATLFDRFMGAKGYDQASPRARMWEDADPFEVPAFPNEDVYFYAKAINNSRVVREADPTARRACWRMIGTCFALAAFVIALLLPTLYGLIAGYRLEALRQERARLELDRAALELQETKLTSPARLEELSRIQRFVDPAPQKVVYLENNNNGSFLAKR